MNIKKSKSTILIVGFALFALVLIGIIAKTQQKTDNAIRIGADIPLTGKFGYFGQQLQKGLQLAEQEANAQKDQIPIRLLVQDNQHDAGQAIAIFDKFATVDGVSVAIALYSPMSKAVRESAVRYKIPLVTTYTTAKDITNDWTFRDFPSMDEQIPPLVQLSYDKLSLRRISCILYQADFGRDARDIFQQRFSKKGGVLIRSEEIPLSGSEDMVRDVVAKILADKPDGVLIVLSAKTLGLAVKRLRESNYEGAILSVVMFDSPEVREVAGNSAEGVYFSGIPFNIETDVEGRKFAAAYMSKFGEAPDYMGVYGYTIGEYLIKLSRQAKGDRGLILEELKKLDMRSIRGQIRVQPDKSIQSPVGLFHVEGSKNTLVNLIN